jgi:hypothetical protein
VLRSVGTPLESHHPVQLLDRLFDLLHAVGLLRGPGSFGHEPNPISPTVSETFQLSSPDKVAPAFDTKSLEKLFTHNVLNMLWRKGKICEEIVKLILSWRHSGFNVHCSPRIRSGDDEAMENLPRYVVRASFSQERMTHVLSCPQQRRADGSLLWVLQQRQSGSTEEGKRGGIGLLNLAARGIIQRLSQELGKAYPENIRGGPP